MSTARSSLGEVGEPCWMDVKTWDVATTGSLLAAVFGWDIVIDEADWRRATKACVDGRWVAGLSDLANPIYPPGLPEHVAFSIAVDDLDLVVDRAETLPGEVLLAPFDAGDQGRVAVLTDPWGPAFSLWERVRPEGWAGPAAGEPAWPKELRWYGREATEAATYYRTHLGLPLKAASFLEGWPDAPRGWTVAIDVPDLDASVDAADSAGATVTPLPDTSCEVLLETAAGLCFILLSKQPFGA